MSEGAGVVVLESLDHVKKRNAESKIYAEILGGSINADVLF
jgi:3-oxoacyl-(acyl-carrier-protein) synthase